MAMLIVLPFVLVAAFVVVAFCCSLRPASPASLNGEDYENAMLNCTHHAHHIEGHLAMEHPAIGIFLHPLVIQHGAYCNSTSQQAFY